MASSIAADQAALGFSPPDAFNDPFVSNPPPSAHLRYSSFDSQLFALGPGASAEQAKRALEAHLAETERRMEEAGKLGTALVQQRKELTERLKEVEELQAEGELTPDLRHKLVEIEKDYNEVARESARAFLPKQRVPSNELAAGSPYVPEGRANRRSVSPSKFESQATGSPTKFGVPNRKLRNQPSNRVHDIEFAAEISTSLIAQVRNLQGLLAEREEELRDTKTDRSRLEVEVESFQQRMKTLDESEHRYKDENWNLETQIHELLASQKEAAEREKKLSQALAVLQADKNSTQRELDEVKTNHSKLVEEHTAAVKHHDIELGTAKRSMVMAESERAAMQRKIDDLTNQNQELAKAFSMARGRALERENLSGGSDDDFESAADNLTPEHSPPPSPIKHTPRHSMLESETLKMSLQHAQRTIQSLRTNVHREKTEKLELKRMLQEARDELEKARAEPAPPVTRRSRKVESREIKKLPKLSQLGGPRTSRSEVVAVDTDWEDERSPSRPPNLGSPASRRDIDATAESTDNFETANETSDAAFETAQERGTETEDFQTGAEEFSDDDAATETESPSKGSGRMKRPPVLPMNQAGNRYSFQSTASTSNEDDEDEDVSYGSEMRTPTASHPQKMRIRVSRGQLSRRSRQASEEPTFQGSPGGFAHSSASTPQKPAQSLFAELGDLDGSDDDESVVATPRTPRTPSRRSIRSVTPSSTARGRTASPPPAVPPIPKLIMVDSGVMTDPVEIQPAVVSPTLVAAESPRPISAFIDPAARLSAQWPEDEDDTRRLSTFSYSDAGAQHDPDMEEKLAQFPSPPTSPHQLGAVPIPILRPPQFLSMSDIRAEGVEPAPEPQAAPPSLGFSSLVAEHVEPVTEPEQVPPPPALSISTTAVTANLEPIAEPEPPVVPPPVLSLSSHVSEHIVPVAEARPTLTLSAVSSEHVEPIAEPEVPPPQLGLSTVVSEHVEPVAEPPSLPPALSLSNLISEHVQPVHEPEVPPPLPPALSISSIRAEHVEPVAVPEPQPVEREIIVQAPPAIRPPEVLSFSSIHAEAVAPQAEPEPPIAPLTLSSVVSEHTEPISPAEPAPPSLAFAPVQSVETTPVAVPLELSTIQSIETEPVVEEIVPAPLGFSSIQSVETEPKVEAPEEHLLPSLGFSSIQSVHMEPAMSRSPKRNAFIIPRDAESQRDVRPRTPPTLVRGKDKAPATPIIAEDDTRQSPNDTPLNETPESQRPFRELSANANAKPVRKHAIATADQGAQTSLTAEAIDEMLNAKTRAGHQKADSVASSIFGTPGTVRIRRSLESMNSVVRHKGKMADASTENMTRPGSSASAAGAALDLPPLPPNHKQVIEAARTGSASGGHGTIGTMGPPLLPASAYRNPALHPRTPSGSRPMSPVSAGSVRGTPTPRVVKPESALGVPDARSSSRLTARSRQSSVSSFVSEMDARFNMHDSMGLDAHGLGPNTDPRMIQAITQTMIGEYLWKYTRKAGRGEMSEKRHRRYFWVHPYTRTLYWSDRDPSSAGRAELRAKSVPIESVHVVTDDNPMPPGLHRKSLVIISPGRTVKFTCTTGQRHETWFNALSYLLLRTNEAQTDMEEMAGGITREDVDEFNPSYGRRPAAGTRAQPPASLSSYNSRTTRNESPVPIQMDMSVPTLTPTRGNRTNTQRTSMGTLGRISGYLKSSGTFSSRRSRSVQGPGIYEASEVHDSAEDLRVLYEQQDREADRLENVRACCDGKHDVGTLSRKKGARHSHAHAHSHSHTHPHSQAGPSSTSTPAGTVPSRA